MGGGDTVIDVPDNHATPSYRPPEPVNPPAESFFVQLAGADLPSHARAVGHAGGEALPRKPSPRSIASASPGLSSPAISASARRSSASDWVPSGPDRILSGAQQAPAAKGRACGSSGGKSRSSCFRISTTLYTVVGGTCLVLALLWLSQYERRVRPRGRFEDVWVPGYHSVNYRLEVEETWEIDGEVSSAAPLCT